MDELKKKLLALFGQQPPPTPAPEAGIDMARPWDSPVLRPPAAATPIAPPATLPAEQRLGAVTPEEEALMQALAKKKINMGLAAATGNPIPR